MELELTRETLRFEQPVTALEEQIVIEGDAALPGSMRDAVTVLSVQAQAHIRDAQAGVHEAAIRGKVNFQVLYTQGDLTRVRALETSCEFERRLKMAGVSPGMQICAWADVQETEGAAQSGRMTLRALLGVGLEASQSAEQDVVVRAAGDAPLRIRPQDVTSVLREPVGAEKVLVREEFDLPAKLGVGDVLCATALTRVEELAGGNGKIDVSGVIEARVLHQAQEKGAPLVMTTHEMPYTFAMDGQIPPDAQVTATAEVIDVMADSAQADKRRTLRVEAEVQVRLTLRRTKQMQVISDLYSLSGPQVEPVTKPLDVLTVEPEAEARESTRIHASLPKDAPPIETVLAAFAQPVLAEATPAGRRLNAEGVMGVTLIYLPVDSDIPCGITLREPFSMTFPIEAEAGVHARIYPIECTAGATTSDRAEIRCVLGLRAQQRKTAHLEAVTDVQERPEEKQAHGFVLVWPPQGESRWETARRLRVAEEALYPAGGRALLAFRK